jgi:hypothetical protein
MMPGIIRPVATLVEICIGLYYMPHQDRSSGQLLKVIFPLRPYQPLTILTEIELSSKVFRSNTHGVQYFH